MGEKSQRESKKMPGPSSPFSLEERIFIVNKFGELKSISDVKRVFQLRFLPEESESCSYLYGLSTCCEQTRFLW